MKNLESSAWGFLEREVGRRYPVAVGVERLSFFPGGFLGLTVYVGLFMGHGLGCRGRGESDVRGEVKASLEE